MAGEDFQAAAAALWARLGLGAPRFTQPGRIRLRVEGTNIDLADNGRGSMEIEAAAGRLAEDPALRARQVRSILASNIALLLDNDAGVFLRQGPDGSRSLSVRSTCGLKQLQVDRLVGKIEAVLRVTEYYAGELKAGGASARRQPERKVSVGEDAVIFRP